MALADVLLDAGLKRGGPDPYAKYGEGARQRRAYRKALGIDLRTNRGVRLAARAGLLPGHAYDPETADRVQQEAQQRLGGGVGGLVPQQATGPASLADLLGVKPAGAGGAAGGRPVVDPGQYVPGPVMDTPHGGLGALLTPGQLGGRKRPWHPPRHYHF